MRGNKSKQTRHGSSCVTKSQGAPECRSPKNQNISLKYLERSKLTSFSKKFNEEILVTIVTGKKVRQLVIVTKLQQ